MDKNFDSLKEQFNQKVYSKGKGKLRISLIKHELEKLTLNKDRLNILDCGCGMGQIGIWLAQQGHKVTFCDISPKMLNEAKESAKNSKQSVDVDFIISSIQNLPEKLKASNQYDLILLHGVIEWMQTPSHAIETVVKYVKKNGVISLLYFNKDKLILKWGINGQTNEAISGKSHKNRPLTPMNPISLDEIKPHLAKHNLSIISRSGIRIFYAFFKSTTEELTDKHIQLELKHMKKEPFASLGEHTHILLQQKSQT